MTIRFHLSSDLDFLLPSYHRTNRVFHRRTSFRHRTPDVCVDSIDGISWFLVVLIAGIAGFTIQDSQIRTDLCDKGLIAIDWIWTVSNVCTIKPWFCNLDFRQRSAIKMAGLLNLNGNLLLSLLDRAKANCVFLSGY